MLRIIQKVLKKEKGFTLVELLATVVILGIIAGIAVPAVGGLIENSKKDAHVANARQMIEAARLKVIGESVFEGSTGIKTITLQSLVEDGYIQSVPSTPGNAGEYDTDLSRVNVTKNDTSDGSPLFVYEVRLASDDTDTVYYIPFEEEKELDRSDVTLE